MKAPKLEYPISQRGRWVVDGQYPSIKDDEVVPPEYDLAIQRRRRRNLQLQRSSIS